MKAESVAYQSTETDDGQCIGDEVEVIDTDERDGWTGRESFGLVPRYANVANAHWRRSYKLTNATGQFRILAGA